MEEIKRKILDTFKDYEFFDSTHTYYYKGNKVSISTTGLIHQYSNEFDKWEMSANVARKRGVSQIDVLKEWEIENLHSTIKGSMIHEFAQSLWEGNKNYIFKYDNLPDLINKRRLQEELCRMSGQAINFYNDYKDMYDLIGCEIYLGVPDFDECGATDMLLMNKFTKELLVIDFKSNKKIDYESYGHKKMKVPLQKYEDCNYIHYSLQLNAYAYKIEYMTGLKVKDKLLIYFDCNKDNYEVIEPLELRKEVVEIYENRRVKNMKSIPILLMGASGTGKTRSLKNLPINETAIINVTNKPLPFKNNGLKVVSSTDYLQIIKAIKETEKKIIVIDDCGYLLTFENFDKATNKGYDKFTIMAQNFYKLIETVRHLDNEKIVYIITHEEVDDDSKIKPKMIGKMLNQQLCVEGLFTIVLRSVYKNGQYLFETKTDGTTVTKSPEDMFAEIEIPNDLAEVDRIVREYYGFNPIGNKEESGANE